MDDGADVWALLPVARPRPTTKEAIAAADLIGAEFHPSLTDDLQIFYDSPTLARLATSSIVTWRTDFFCSKA